jgi:hypothetical protein
VIPWNVTFIIGNNLSYHPRPVFQSYSVYSSKLDQLNFYAIRESPPDIIVYSYESIDNRYPLFEEPSVIREILINYSKICDLSDFIIFQRKEIVNEYELSPTGSGIYHFNEEIPIDSHIPIVGKIHINLTPSGLIKGLLYKPSQVYVQFKLQDDYFTPKYRIIPDVLKNGVILSPYVSNLNDFSKIGSNSGNLVKSVIFSHDPSNDWDKNIDITFYSLNLTNGWFS